MTDVMERLESSYATWSDSAGANVDVWAELIDDQVNFRTLAQRKRGHSFAQARQSREEMLAHFRERREEWAIDQFTAKTIIREHNRVAMFGTTKWTYRATGKSCELLIAHLWRFRNGKAVELVEIFDSARAVAAMTPDH